MRKELENIWALTISKSIREEREQTSMHKQPLYLNQIYYDP